MKLRTHPYNLLLLAGLALIVSSLFINQSTVDIHLHDTYYVISKGHVFWAFAVIVWVLWFLNWLAQKIIYSKMLVWVHVIVTLLTILFLLFLLNFSDDILNPKPKRYLDFNNWQSFNNYSQKYFQLTYYSILGLVLAQVIFVINILIGFIKRLK